MMFNWLRKMARRGRAAKRAADVKFLWPAIAKQCNGDFLHFVDAATHHMVNDPAWWGHDDEWADTDAEPGHWWNKHRPDLAAAKGEERTDG